MPAALSAFHRYLPAEPEADCTRRLMSILITPSGLSPNLRPKKALPQITAFTLRREGPCQIGRDRCPGSGVLFQATYVIWLQRRMQSLDGVAQDGHHHALPAVASPPGPGDVERRAASGAAPAPLRSKEKDVHVSWESGIRLGSGWSEGGEGGKKTPLRLTGNRRLLRLESL